MTTTFNPKPPELTVANFGPIAEASIELRPMSVFVGPSNTGKSYMAVLIYALHKFFSEYWRYEIQHQSLNLSEESEYWRYEIQYQDRNLSEENAATILAWAEEYSDLQRARPGQPSLVELPESIATLVRSFLLHNIQQHSERYLEGEIVRCFGVDKAKELIRHSSDSQTLLSLCHNFLATGGNDLFRYNFALTKRGSKIDASIPNILPPIRDSRRLFRGRHRLFFEDWTNKLESEKDYEEIRWFADKLLSNLSADVVSNIFAPLNRPAYYFPADRAGVMHAHQVAVRGLISSASRTALRRDSPMPVLPGVLGDFLEQLVGLADRRYRTHESDNDLALRLEQALLKGTVQVEQSQIDYPSFVYRPDGWERDLPLMNASSMISELAPVVLYLRHVVESGDLLIIEEPESHLHPTMQVAFIRQLAAAVQAGIRIIITTHSEWVLEELANLVRLSELPTEQREGIDDADIALGPEQVGAWLFEPTANQSGSVVREISLDTESATFPAGFGLVTESLYNRWSEISTRIEEK